MRLNAYHNNTCTLAKFQCQWNKRQGSRNSVNGEIYVYLTWPGHIATKKKTMDGRPMAGSVITLMTSVNCDQWMAI